MSLWLSQRRRLFDVQGCIVAIIAFWSANAIFAKYASRFPLLVGAQVPGRPCHDYFGRRAELTASPHWLQWIYILSSGIIARAINFKLHIVMAQHAYISISNDAPVNMTRNRPLRQWVDTLPKYMPFAAKDWCHDLSGFAGRFGHIDIMAISLNTKRRHGRDDARRGFRAASIIGAFLLMGRFL